ncbi:PEP-CTERM system histidine kinase PrsK [Alteromonas sp. LMIT006]|uniref:XrtA/PEP-CTERM system histidine kinase PrsK n=1 Tax=Alteromonadaceae TaxID=72275 RepID=UPI0020CA96F2|nr:XrtA/PEP-CTERM system histidine kinase PrsK [Alteromonas sp. LMIT006]UTP73717.1 PEP-CTERM system histidine kinase PrsK [Alteromonas sp. LMIT006]
MFGNIGFSLTAVGFASLFLLLLTVTNSSRVKFFLALAFLLTALWALQHITWIVPQSTLQQYLLFDSLKQLGWILLLSAALHNQADNVRQVFAQRSTVLAIIAPVFCIVSSIANPSLTEWIFLALTVSALTILLQLELLFRQAGEQRWAFKPLVIFLGMVNVLEFVTYANASMVNYLGVHFIAAKGYVYTLFLPFMFLAMRRMEHWGIKIFVSREIVLHSTLLLVAGAYLFLMAVVGYIIKYQGGTWGTSVQIVIAIVALFLLGVLLASANLRQRIKVFITKNFFANQFDYRERWIALTNILEVGEKELNEVYDTALHGCLKSIEYDRGVLCKFKNNELLPVASSEDIHLRSMDWYALNAVAVYCQDKPWIVDLNELIVHPENYPNIALTPVQAKQSSLQFIMPIYHESTLWGVVAMYQVESVFRTLNWELRDYLNAILAQVSNFILHHEASHMVAENAQFAAFSRMSAFVVHDLKNVLAQVDLILANATQHKHNPEFIEDTFVTLEHTQARMQKMLKQLTEKHTQAQTSAQVCELSSILKTVIHQLCATLQPTPTLSITTDLLANCDCDKLQNVLYHIVSNAQQATPDEGAITIEVRTVDPKHILLTVTDTGCGMSEEFIKHRLFKPFDTTKGNAGMGIGAYDAKHFIEDIGGRVDVMSEEGKGTVFSLYIPAISADKSTTAEDKEVNI